MSTVRRGAAIFLLLPALMAAAQAREAVDDACGVGCGRLQVPVPENGLAIGEEARAALAAWVDCVVARGGTRVVLVGHTEERGSAPYNVALGSRLAEMVRREVVAAGFDGHIEVRSAGEEEPLCGAAASECRSAENRRVEAFAIDDRDFGACRAEASR